MSPTGYTEALYEGRPVTFEEFALRCARNFGALIEMRDSGLDATIPDTFEPSTYYSDRLAEGYRRLAELDAMTFLECEAKALAAFAEWDAKRRAYIAESDASRERYEAMLANVLRWTPPTDEHTGLRDFMVAQLEESIRFDAPEDRTYYPAAPPTDGVAWREQEIAEALRSIGYAAAELAKERARAAQRTAWVRALRRSLAEFEPVPR